MVYLIVCSACLILFGEVPRNLLIFPLFWEIVQRINQHHLRLKRSSNTQSTFSSRDILVFDLSEVLDHLLCAILFKWAVLISLYQDWAWWSENVLTRFPEKKRIIVIGEYIIYRSSCWYSASWAEDVRKEKGRVH